MNKRNTGLCSAVLMLMGACMFWEIAVRLNGIPVYILPAPSRALQALFSAPAYYTEALLVTLGEAFVGLLFGLFLGIGVAVLVNLQPALERGIMMLAILLKSTPLVAIAPLLTIWLGFGVLPKIIITALLTFFPVLVNALVGLQSAERDMLDLMNVHRATKWQILRYLNLYLALPYIFAALRMAAPLALVGAVIAEWTGASSGLGRVMWLAYANLNLPPLFAAIFILSLSGMAAYGTMAWLETRVIRWKK